MSNKFRNELTENDKEFNCIFNELKNAGQIEEYSKEIWDIILRDRTAIRINNEPLAFKDLFHQDLTEGRCEICVFEFVLLLDKLGIYSEAVKCINEHFKGTAGSSYGGHWYVEAYMNKKVICIDTSLVVMGTPKSFESLGHKVIRKYDIDTLFKEYGVLIDYYDKMIINKNNL